jgi:plastocyanin
MRTLLALAYALLACTTFAACGDDDDDATLADATPHDALQPDGPDVDADPDQPDAAPVDAPPVLVDAGIDATPPPPGCALNYAGCTSYEDHTADDQVDIATTGSFTYAPKCITVKVGTPITVAASTTHPFASGTCSPQTYGNDVSTPVTFTPTEPGVYGYFCTHHGSNSGSGMAGAVRVVE